jgi:hypothetical protein
MLQEVLCMLIVEESVLVHPRAILKILRMTRNFQESLRISVGVQGGLSMMELTQNQPPK